MNAPAASCVFAFALMIWCRASGVDGWHEDFSKGMDQWWHEGGHRIWVENERLNVAADNPSIAGGGAATIWSRRKLPSDFDLKVEACVVGSTIQANNINLLFCYSDPFGQSLEATRDRRSSAEYQLYHNLNGYIVTFLNDKGTARIRLRRNPGFALLAETRGGECTTGEIYTIGLRKRGGMIVVYVNGVERLRATDPHPWSGGSVALRTFRTELWWDNLSVYPAIPGNVQFDSRN